MRSWRLQNPDHSHHLWDSHDLTALIRTQYPEYLDLWTNQLAKGVEKADFGRYLVVYHVGGVYADADAECVRPMTELLASEGNLVVGWEHFRRRDQARDQAQRQAQLTQWWFAAPPRHPALRAVMDAIKALGNVTMFDTIRDTIERTGPGLHTSVLLPLVSGAAAEPPCVPGAPPQAHCITILPQTVAGNMAGNEDNHFTRFVKHHFTRSWCEGWGWCWWWGPGWLAWNWMRTMLSPLPDEGDSYRARLVLCFRITGFISLRMASERPEAAPFCEQGRGKGWGRRYDVSARDTAFSVKPTTQSVPRSL